MGAWRGTSVLYQPVAEAALWNMSFATLLLFTVSRRVSIAFSFAVVCSDKEGDEPEVRWTVGAISTNPRFCVATFVLSTLTKSVMTRISMDYIPDRGLPDPHSPAFSRFYSRSFSESRSLLAFVWKPYEALTQAGQVR